MIILRLSGGLGNQIFQLGAALLLAQTSNITNIIIDDSSLNQYKAKRKNDLTKFFDFSLSHINIQFSQSFIARLRLPKLFPLKLRHWPLISEKNFQEALISSSLPILLLDGYFQKYLSQDSFNNIVKLLSRIFKLPIVGDEPSKCVMHIRGGDFLSFGWDSVTPINYYQSAIEYMSKKYSIKEFLVITDDPSYAIKVMTASTVLHQYKLISGDIISDFQIIASIKRRIISNSTFALWASALGNNKDSVIIAPKLFTPNSIRPFRLKGETECYLK